MSDWTQTWTSPPVQYILGSLNDSERSIVIILPCSSSAQNVSLGRYLASSYQNHLDTDESLKQYIEVEQGMSKYAHITGFSIARIETFETEDAMRAARVERIATMNAARKK